MEPLTPPSEVKKINLPHNSIQGYWVSKRGPKCGYEQPGRCGIQFCGKSLPRLKDDDDETEQLHIVHSKGHHHKGNKASAFGGYSVH